MTRKRKQSWIWKSIKFLAKLIFVYPVKFILWIIKKIWELLQKIKIFKNDRKKTKSLNKTEKPTNDSDNAEIKKESTIKKLKTKFNIKNGEVNFDPFDLVKTKKGNLQKFENKLFSNKSMIGLILGARGTGKSAIGMRLLENFKEKSEKNIYAIGFKQESLPEWITVVHGIDDVQNNSVLLIDEGGIEFSSRKAMTTANKLLSELLLVARHKDLSVMFITQNSSNLEVNAIRQADFLLLKPSSLLQKDFERKKIKQIYESIEEEFEEIKHTLGITYLFSDSFQGFATNSLPSFWSDKVSKGYAKK
ncbi:hypothetical protein HN587_07295 [Candidatus Woesearchaeota archaeon]|jgi:hypothetical protein|nr:hypothetical protein [Candidatus Woesearchaeota archaeon]